ncbi:MAG: phage/plasmid primase, P4 family [Planctomycetaceae bacterium]
MIDFADRPADEADEREEFASEMFSVFRADNEPTAMEAREQPRAPDITLDAVNTSEGQTDLANARRLAHWHRDDIRYCHAWKRWLAWDGCRFAPDEDGAVVRLAKAVADRIWNDARQFDDRNALNFAARTASGSGINAMLKLAQSDVPILPEEMDANRWLLNCRNGTVDLRTGELREHRREDSLTKVCATEFDPHAFAPTWETFLDDDFDRDRELIAFVQRLMGYAVCGDVREQVLPIFHGSGANGKSTLLNAVMETLGTDYAGPAPKDLLMVRKGDSHPTELASLFGRRLVVSMETEGNAALAESLVKQLTGGDAISCRRMREDFWSFQPSHTLILCTNHKPRVKGSDHAIWRRLRLVPFAVQFSGDRQDKSLPDKLRGEREGILAWLVRGCQQWQQLGLANPDAVLQATAEYRNDSDVLGRFIEERCCVGEGFEARFKQLFDSFEEWASDAGERTPSKRALGQMLTEKGFIARQSSGRVYTGIGMKE